MTATIAQAQIWDNLHRFCTDDPGEIKSLDEARYILTRHSGHGPECLQYLAALNRASTTAGW